MARIAVTGSTTGVGFNAAELLVQQGHTVVVHARNEARAATLPRDLPVVIGDLEEPAQVVDLAEQFNRYGTFDAVIHNAGIDETPTRISNSVGQPTVLAVNLYAPHMLTALMQRPARLVYLSSSMHYDGTPSFDDIEWNTRSWNGTQAYSDSKLFVTTYAMALARRWPRTVVHAVDPGWVPTRMGGPTATDPIELGHRTQVWLSTATHEQALASGGYWFHRDRLTPAAACLERDFQERLLDHLEVATGVPLP